LVPPCPGIVIAQAYVVSYLDAAFDGSDERWEEMRGTEVGCLDEDGGLGVTDEREECFVLRYKGIRVA
jgi:hypothetical protein